MMRPPKKNDGAENYDEQVKILCVDDERNVLRALGRLFMDDDYEMFTAESAEEGIEILRAQENIQIVISDYRMPGMNGIDFLRGVCRNWPDTVRIVLSGYADTVAVVEAINDGEIYKFIPKPWNDDELRVAIQKAIERYFLKKKNNHLMERLKFSNEKLRKVNEAMEVVVKKALKAAFQQPDKALKGNLFNFLPAGIMGIDAEGCVVYSNDAVRTMVGETEEDILGSCWTQVLPAPFHPLVEKLIDRGDLFEPWQFNGQNGWAKGSRVDLGSKKGVVLGFDWEKEQ